MSYAIIYAENALREVFDLDAPPEIADCIERWISALAADPVRESYRDIAIAPWGQVFDFECRESDGLYRFRALFHYMENEADLRVVSLRVDKWPLEP